MYVTVAGSMPDSRYACSSTAACPAGFGAMGLSERPSLLTALPLMIPSTGSPSRSASRSGASRITPAPSPGTMPSAAPSNARQRPDGESAPAPLSSWYGVAVRLRFTPPTSARSHSPRRRLAEARCSATSEDEQAVSTAMAGPVRFRQCAILPAIRFRRLPTAADAWSGTPAASAPSSSSW